MPPPPVRPVPLRLGFAPRHNKSNTNPNWPLHRLRWSMRIYQRGIGRLSLRLLSGFEKPDTFARQVDGALALSRRPWRMDVDTEVDHDTPPSKDTAVAVSL